MNAHSLLAYEFNCNSIIRASRTEGSITDDADWTKESESAPCVLKAPLQPRKPKLGLASGVRSASLTRSRKPKLFGRVRGACSAPGAVRPFQSHPCHP